MMRDLVAAAVLLLMLASGAQGATLTGPDTTTGAYTLALTADEAKTYARAVSMSGPGFLEALITSWLAERATSFLEQDKTTMRLRFLLRDPATQRKIMNLITCGQEMCP